MPTLVEIALKRKKEQESTLKAASEASKQASPLPPVPAEVVNPAPKAPRKPRETKLKIQPPVTEFEPLEVLNLGTRDLKIEILRGLYEVCTGKRNREMNKVELLAWLASYKGEKVLFFLF